MTVEHSDRVPARKRAIAIAEIGVLLALGALVVLAFIVGQSAEDSADAAPGVVSAPEPEAAIGGGTEDTSQPSTSPAWATTRATPPQESMTTDAAPTPATSEPAMNAAQTVPVDDDTATDVTLTTDPPPSSFEPEATIPKPDVTAHEPGVTAVIEGPFVEIDIGGPYGCGLLENGHLKCWGRGPVPASAPQNAQFLTIDADSYSTCAIRAEGGLQCWGPSGDLYLGDDIGPYTSIALEARVLCALRFDERILCSASKMNPDHHTVGRNGFKTVVAGRGTFCAIEASGAALCWDEYFNVEILGLPGIRLLSGVEPPDGPFEALYMSTEGFNACAIRTDDSAACWGNIEMDLAGRYSKLALGRAHSCGLQLSGEVICWGWDHWGQADAPNGVFVDISVGSRHSCGLRATGELMCWGDSEYNQTDVPTGWFTVVESRAHRNCALRSDGAAVCWGQPF